MFHARLPMTHGQIRTTILSLPQTGVLNQGPTPKTNGHRHGTSTQD